MATFTDITHISARPKKDYPRLAALGVWALVSLEALRWIYDALVAVFSN